MSAPQFASSAKAEKISEESGSLRSRAVWIVADQAVSSLANAGLTFVLARAVSATGYGAFALAFSLYTLMQAVSQAMSGQVLIIRYSAASREVRAGAAAAATGATMIGAVVAGSLLAVAALTLDAPVRSVLLVAAAALPALLVQDMWRTAFVSRGTPSQAFWNDSLWTVLQILGMAWLTLEHVHSPAAYVAVWGLAAVVAALYGVRQAGGRPRLTTTWPWLRDHLDISLPSLGNAVAVLGASQIAFISIATVASVADVGALRAALTLLGPLNIIGFAATAFAVPELVRRRLDRGSLVRSALLLSGVMLTLDACWGVCLLLIPDQLGQALLGTTWTRTREALPGMVAFTCLIGVTTGANAVMRALDRTTYTLYASLLLGPLVLAGSVAGSALDGARGAALGFALAGALVVPPTWLLLRKAVRLGPRRTP